MASRTEGEVQITASQSWTGATTEEAIISRMAGGAMVWIRPTRL